MLYLRWNRSPTRLPYIPHFRPFFLPCSRPVFPHILSSTLYQYFSFPIETRWKRYRLQLCGSVTRKYVRNPKSTNKMVINDFTKKYYWLRCSALDESWRFVPILFAELCRACNWAIWEIEQSQTLLTLASSDVVIAFFHFKFFCTPSHRRNRCCQLYLRYHGTVDIHNYQLTRSSPEINLQIKWKNFTFFDDTKVLTNLIEFAGVPLKIFHKMVDGFWRYNQRRQKQFLPRKYEFELNWTREEFILHPPLWPLTFGWQPHMMPVSIALKIFFVTNSISFQFYDQSSHVGAQ